MNTSDHSSRVAAALAENASRKRETNGMASSSVRSKVPRGNLPNTRNTPDTSGGMLVPPQISGRLALSSDVVTDNFLLIDLFVPLLLTLLKLSFVYLFKSYLNDWWILN